MKTLLDDFFHGRGLFKAVVVRMAVLVFAVPAHANSVIVWGAAQNIFGDTDVSTNGTLVGAFNLGAAGVGDTTVNGVTFAGLALTGNDITSGNFNLAGPFGANNSLYTPGPFGLSAAYETLIGSGSSVFVFPFTLTMSGLVPGLTYEFQWWCNENSLSGTDTSATAGNTVDLVSSVGSFGSIGSFPGQFAIGTFVADATTVESITFSTGFFATVNGFQLRQVSTVPETAGTFALLGLALLGLALISRKSARFENVQS